MSKCHCGKGTVCTQVIPCLTYDELLAGWRKAAMDKCRYEATLNKISRVGSLSECRGWARKALDRTELKQAA